MDKIILDANVITKWFITEENSDKALSIQKKYVDRKIEIIIPSLLYFEVLNTLKYSSLFDKSELKSVGESLEKYGFTISPIKGEIRDLMIEIAVEYELTIYDAVYVALGEGMGIPFCTNDEKIVKKLPSRLKKNIMILREYKI
jgi:predicted nucleic acid-binding protein